MSKYEGPGQLPLLPGMRFARHSHVMRRDGARRTPGPAIRAGECRSPVPALLLREGGGRAGYLAAPWAAAEGRVLGLGTIGGRQGTVRGLGCGALPAAPQRGPAALRPSGAGQTAGRSIGVQFCTSQPCRLDMYLEGV